MQNAITKIETGAVALAAEPVNMLQVIQRAAADPACDVAKMERLLDMAERMDAKRAEMEFNAAFAALQADMPVIVAKTEIKNRGKYERFEDVMEVVGPLLKKHGFAISFAQDSDDKRITVTCTLRHIGGHSHKNPFSVRLGVAADSNTQADCKVSTTARRNALLQALNIVIRQDALQSEDDATIEGNLSAFVTPEQADELERRVAETNSDKAAFLKFAGAAKFSEIPAANYARLDASLRRKEGGAR